MTPTSEFKVITSIGIIFGFSLFAFAATAPLAKEGPSNYIVVLKNSSLNTETEITDIEKKHGVSSGEHYSKALKGFTVSLTPLKLAKMKLDSRVAFVSEDRVVTINGKPDSAGASQSKGSSVSAVVSVPTPQKQETKGESVSAQASSQSNSQSNANSNKDKDKATSTPDGVEDRAGNRGKSGKATSTDPVQSTQLLPTGIRRIGAVNLLNKGTGVGVAIIDTGIDLTHPDLAANIGSASKSCISGTLSAQDDNGHGTHVAGTIAALNNSIGVVGIAPEAKLYPVKVLDSTGSGTWSSIICGIDWVTANAQALNIKVANMSLGGVGISDNNCGLSNNDALHRAICNSTAQGVTYVVAAGNNASDATQTVPASYSDTVIAVSALADSDGNLGGTGTGTSYGADDTFASFSNFGSPVALGAPGVNILSTWKGGTYNTISGTSMASPHVAGVAALYLKANPTATWTKVRDALRAVGEPLGSGHTDATGLHVEPVLKALSF